MADVTRFTKAAKPNISAASVSLMSVRDQAAGHRVGGPSAIRGRATRRVLTTSHAPSPAGNQQDPDGQQAEHQPKRVDAPCQPPASSVVGMERMLKMALSKATSLTERPRLLASMMGVKRATVDTAPRCKMHADDHAWQGAAAPPHSGGRCDLPKDEDHRLPEAGLAIVEATPRNPRIAMPPSNA